ncbi:MAG: tRNA (adenosine(37)-N6)-threonylcarbamoyltransferase complex ATPase subunit type 1 TsaE [Synechococcaceae cyanobacterium]
MQHWRLADAAATRALGRELAARLVAARQPETRDTPPILLLQGELGAGKTCLVQGIAVGLGITEPITSPTFALAQHYSGVLPDGTPSTLVHLDLYRLEQPGAAEELFAQEEELAGELGALLAVEWPGRLSAPPRQAWLLELELADPADPEAGRIAGLHLPAGFSVPD